MSACTVDDKEREESFARVLGMHGVVERRASVAAATLAALVKACIAAGMDCQELTAARELLAANYAEGLPW